MTSKGTRPPTGVVEQGNGDGETGQEPGRYQPRDPPARGAAYARDGYRHRDRQDAQQAEGKISHRRGRVRQLNDRGEPEARGQARDHEAGSPPPHDRQASPRAGGQGQRASRQAGQDDRDVRPSPGTGQALRARAPLCCTIAVSTASQASVSEMDAIAAAAPRLPVSPSSTTASQAIITTTHSPREGGTRSMRPERDPRGGGCSHGSPSQGEEDEHHRRGDQAHDGQGVLPGVGGQPAGDPADPDHQAAGGQVHRLAQARRALSGPGGGQQHAEHLLPVELAVGGRVAAQQAQVASFQDGRPGRVPHWHVPSHPGGLAGSARAHAVPPASRARSRCAATAALARRRSVSAASSVAPSSVSR